MRLEICRMQHEKHRCTRCDLSYMTESYMTNHSVYTGLKRYFLKVIGYCVKGRSKKKNKIANCTAVSKKGYVYHICYKMKIQFQMWWKLCLALQVKIGFCNFCEGPNMVFFHHSQRMRYISKVPFLQVSLYSSFGMAAPTSTHFVLCIKGSIVATLNV